MNSGLDRLVGLAFWTLAVLCLLNLNGLVFLWTGVEQAFSPLILLCCIVALAGMLRVRTREALGTPGLLIVACLAAYTGIGIVMAIINGSELQTQATEYLRRHLGSVLIILAGALGGRLVWLRIGGGRVLAGVAIILTAGCLLILASPWLRDIFRNSPQEGAYRYFGSFANPNDAALIACFSFVLALALMRRGRARLVVYGTFLVALAAAVGTLSRTAIVVLPALVVASVVVSRGTQRRRLATGLLTTALVLTTVWANLDPNMFEDRQIARISSLRDLGGRSTIDDVALAGRATLWRLAADEALEAPLVGKGLGRLHHLDSAWYNDDEILMGAHNQYLILLGEAGFLPLGLFVVFLGVAVHAGFRQRRSLWPLGAVTGWSLTLILFSITFHGILMNRAACFVIGLSCAVMASCLPGEDARPATTSAP